MTTATARSSASAIAIRGRDRTRSGTRRRSAASLGAFVALTIGLVFVNAPAVAAVSGTSGQNGTHDPSRMTKVGGTYYVYSTGSTIPMMFSTDGTHWKSGPPVFPSGIPVSLRRAVPGFNGNVWAPDVLFVRGQYRLYYAVWGSKTSSAIGLATSPTLDPNARNYHWTDQGVVVSVDARSGSQAIDPAPFEDRNGNDYLSFGSGYPYRSDSPQLFVTRLDNLTGKAAGATVPIWPGHVEASYVAYHNGYYYLFFNTGSCCSGTASTYEIHVARSTSPTGPYAERQSSFLSSTGMFHGPGQIGILSERGTDYFTFHYYPTGRSVLGIGTIAWGADGWPSATGASPSPAPGGQQVLYDDFESDAVGSHPADWAAESGTWSICQPPNASREYCETALNGVTRPTIANQDAWTDYAVDAAAYRNVAQNANGGSMILGRVVDASHFYALELRSDIGGTKRPFWYIERHDPSGYTVLAGGPFTTHTIPYYRLRLSFTGSTISASVAYDYTENFVTLGSARDTTYAKGGIGLRAQNDPQERFDDVRVTLSAGQPTPSPHPTATPSPKPTTPPGTPSIVGLHVVKNALVNAKGQAIALHGVDRSGTEYACVQNFGIFDGPSDATSIAAIASWRTNAVRVPLNEDCWLAINGVSSAYAGANYHTAIANYVKLLNAKGLVAILDLHWNNSGTQSATGQKPMADSDHAPTFWKSVASTFESNSSVVFDLYNEPYGISWSCWRDGGSASACGTPFAIAGMNSLIAAVRSTGSKNVVMAGGLAYSNDLSQWLAYEPKDATGNLAASWHVYNFNACTTTSCWNAQVAPVAARVPLVAGEIGENDCAHGFIDTLMPWLDQHHGSYLGWSWNADFNCNSGPGLISNYDGTPTNFGIGLRSHFASL